MTDAAQNRRDVPLVFGAEEWQEEVERLDPRSPARAQAERARTDIEDGRVEPDLKRCRDEDSPDGTSLPGGFKVYVPLGKQGASEAPHGFVFQLQQQQDGGLFLNFLAFGERHPQNPATRTVYERAHKRLHGRYP